MGYDCDRTQGTPDEPLLTIHIILLEGHFLFFCRHGKINLPIRKYTADDHKISFNKITCWDEVALHVFQYSDKLRP